MAVERVLVTGAAGFVGRAVLAPLAARGMEVHGVAHRSVPACASPVRWHQADLLDPGEARRLIADLRPACIVHAAWYVAHGRFWTAPENAEWLEASTALAALHAEAGGRRFVGLGTCAEYADAAPDDGRPWPETRPLRPQTPYGEAKMALAARLERLAGERPGFSVAWARLFHLFGPGEHPARLVPSVISALAEGREALCGSGLPIRDFASTGHVGRAIAALAASPVEGPVNVATGQARAIRDIVEAIADAMDARGLVRFGRLPDRATDPGYAVADTGRLRRAVGFDEPFDLHHALAGVIAAHGGVRSLGRGEALPPPGPPSTRA